MLQYTKIILKLIEAQKAMDAVAVLLRGDNTFNNDALAILGDMEHLKMCIEDQEASEDPDREKD